MNLLQALGIRRADGGTTRDVTSIAPVILNSLHELPVEKLYQQQPHLRAVTTFIARMVASVSLHVYERAVDGGRERVRDGSVAAVLSRPNSSETMYELIYGSIMDLCLYDEFIWITDQDTLGTGEWSIYRIPPHWVQETEWANRWDLLALCITGAGGERVWVPADKIIRVHGYSPYSPREGLAPVAALRSTLKEQLSATLYRAAMWENGPQISGIISRPAGVSWSDNAREVFKRSWRSQFTRSGSGIGGVPVLEDGMTFTPMKLSARDEELVEMTKLSLNTVCQVYHVNPTMVGQLDNANYSNVREFRQSLYGDTLGPLMKQIESALNAFLLPRLDDTPGRYIEFNVEERLRGRFEEQVSMFTSAVGAPWLTRNEARAKSNLPAIDGGDALIVPLNTTVSDSGSDNEDMAVEG